MIETHWQGQVAIIRLNRPDKKNALTPDMLDSLSDQINGTCGAARSLVLSGAGDAFCSGFDLAMCLENHHVLGQLLRRLSTAILALRMHPAPVVIAAHGAAIAGGCALLGGADVVITNADAKLGYPVTPLGISPAVSAPFLAAAVGEGQARTRLLEPRLINGLEAARIGLAHECLPSAADVFPRAVQRAVELAAKPPGALQATKAWLNQLDGTLAGWPRQTALNTSLSLVGSPEERERLAAHFAR